METKKGVRKLSLEKLTISKLSREEMKQIVGAGDSDGFGASLSQFTSCQDSNSGVMSGDAGHVAACHNCCG